MDCGLIPETGALCACGTEVEAPRFLSLLLSTVLGTPWAPQLPAMPPAGKWSEASAIAPGCAALGG